MVIHERVCVFECTTFKAQCPQGVLLEHSNAPAVPSSLQLLSGYSGRVESMQPSSYSKVKNSYCLPFIKVCQPLL